MSNEQGQSQMHGWPAQPQGYAYPGGGYVSQFAGDMQQGAHDPQASGSAPQAYAVQQHAYASEAGFAEPGATRAGPQAGDSAGAHSVFARSGSAAGPYAGFSQAVDPHADAPHDQPGYPTAQPGLLDTSFATSTTQQTAKWAYVAVIILSAVLVLVGLFGAVGDFATIEFSGITAVLRGLSSLLLYGGLALVVLTVGRLVVDYFVQEDRKRG